ncbi:hypothetical protein ABIF65_003724 [Bradyrhizobium japonicum]|jgi:hypothetical protein|uniref:hypothetical protein n=1 Tax=Bradyrhizobium TaxID=374 RepID=UPI0004B70B4A|nr:MULTISPECIES: hypothetical protein [Bradyrhizobium]MBR0998793.1 hypothetical protein [Bradyrhizobium liaoningense]MBR1030073.1 hypothetical protein [Bradyrhizobium liaoningense]MBR1066872.1 hypothetical protein [Bradyrhizobium liaoningense]MDI2075497.1 hypothetical protein [Bradyrhizobium sp. Mp27]
MTYSCSDFTDSILDALKIEVPDESNDSPSDQADLALSEIERLQQRDGQLKLLETAPGSRLERVRLAAQLLRTARNHLRIAGANNAADYVQRALKSVQGAERHARGMETRATIPAAG